MFKTNNVKLKLSCSLCKGWEAMVAITYTDVYNIKAESSPDVINGLRKHFEEKHPDYKENE